MEVVLFGVFTALLWIASLTVLLPFFLLLKFNKSIRNRWFTWFLVKVYRALFLKAGISPVRKRAFEILNESIEKEQRRDAPLEILEIGIGDGANLQLYPENSNLTALDMNKNFEVYLLENLKKYSHVTHKRTVIAMAENMPEIEDSSMDIVVCSLVLCSVKSIASVLAEVKRVLKPGGKFLFAEHVAFPKSEWDLINQRFISLLWRVYFDGCIPDRDTADEIKKGGFSDVLCENMLTDNPLYFIRPHIVGIATK